MVKERSPEPTPQKPKKIQTKPGFAQGAFGKAIAYILLVYSILGSIGIVMNWFNGSTADQSVGYRVGVGIGVLSLVLGAWRGIIRREKRSSLDWIVGVFLLFICVMTIPALATLLNSTSVDSLDVGMGIALALTVAQLVVTLIVAIRLLRQPYYPPKETLQTIFE